MGKRPTAADLDAMAARYGVADNPLFIEALERYKKQTRLIGKMIREVNKAEDLIVSKEYVKGRENIVLHPLAKELPNHINAANKSLDTLVNLIKTLGHEQVGSRLSAMRSERDD